MGATKEGKLLYTYISHPYLTLALVNFLGCGGLWEQIPYQNLDPQCQWTIYRFFFLVVVRKLTQSSLFFPHSTAIIAKIKQLSNGCRSRWDGPRALNRAIRRWFYKGSGSLEKE